ncbi:MAG: nitric oxide dioxygenase [Acidiphilium sp. 37-64-53]|uniref:NO-inducible flavohemoprotein n=1 Tax=Acidiphilium sp. 37-64-53 TaxID=1970299 RepID=UPI000BDB5D94|nr:NO-inducible flavohemoprotein [Acidiphilium sp. 37-64-53]OYV99762.1 MAG: nitric oxide dioxygenase [Acidiphilium sp. 37-64-53]HQT89782.1 NO-inducible flavohemoprotein [Acidiphilium sp.]
MTDALSLATIQLIKATVPALEVHGLEITKRMYERLFQDSAIKDLFNQSHHGAADTQPKALADAVLAYGRHIDNLGVLGGAVERIAQKHVALNILPEHYPFVAQALLGAIQDVLGDAATPEICAAWGEAYWFLAEILIGREAAVYRDLASQPGGWNGWRDFIVKSVADESEIIRSFVLHPADGKVVIRHRPGQYLGFLFDVPGYGTLKRNYSISCGPNDQSYQITVKREATPGIPPGLVSNWLHDQATLGTIIKVTPPAGDFFLEQSETAPVVLISGGVGLTPMMSMLEAISATTPERPTWHIHGALNGRVHAMAARMRQLSTQAKGIHTHIFYASPEAGDLHGEHYDEAGLINADWLARHTPIADATYFLCGPKPFLRSLINGLAAKGLPSIRIRYEFFGPTEDLTVAT